MKKYRLLLLCFVFVFAAEVFAQPYTVVKLPLSSELLQRECLPSYLSDDETIIWACRAAAYRQSIAGQIEKINIEDEENIIEYQIVWLTQNEFVYPIYRNNGLGSSSRVLMRCSEEGCYEITPPNSLCTDPEDGGIVSNSRGGVFYWCLYKDANTNRKYTAIYNIPSRSSADEITQVVMPYPFNSLSVHNVATSFVNKINQIIILYFTNNAVGQLWDGVSVRKLPKGQKRNLWPLAFFDSGQVVGVTNDIAWKPHIISMTGRKVKELHFTTKAGQRLMKKGTSFQTVAKAADGSALIRIFPYHKQKASFAVIKGTKIELVKLDPTIDYEWTVDSTNDCGSAVGIKRPAHKSKTTETELLLLRKEGC